MKNKCNKKMATPRHKFIHNLIPIHLCNAENLGLFVFNVATIRQRKEHKCILTFKCLSYIKCGVVLKEKQRCRDG